jgi:hypothetical protein
MAFELDIFEQVVNGSLAPWLFPKGINAQKHWQEYLHAELSYATRQVHVRYRQQNEQWIIQGVDAHLFDRQQLPAFLRLQRQVQVPEVEGKLLLGLLLEELSIDQSSISEWYHWQDETGEVQLEAYMRIAWESLSYEEQRFCFYQQLLEEQVRLAEQNMRDLVHTTASRQAAEIYLQKHQQALVRFSNLLTENLGTNQPSHTLSGNYLLTDVLRLILQQVDRLSAFLFQEFTGYLDPDLPAPYSHKVLTLKQQRVLVEELSVLVEDRVTQGKVQDAALQKLLQEVLDDFKAMGQQPTSLRQLAHWQEFLPRLEKLLKGQADKEPLYYLTSLTAINFNHPGFVVWCQNLIEQDLDGQHTVSGKLDRLYYFQKQIRQVRLFTEHSFTPNQASVQTQLSDWIGEEIRYWQHKAQNEKNDTKEERRQPEIERIPTNMTIAQVALLLRLLQETDLLPTPNKARMFRAFAQILLTQNQQEIAAESLKAKYHQPDESSIRALKEKVKAMLDLLNDPSHWQ